MSIRKSLALLLLVLGCKTAEHKAEAPPAAPPPAPKAAPGPISAGLDESALDPSADPCTDFYQYACGGWLAKTEIPPDRPSWSRGFDEIAQRNENLLREILEQLAKGELRDTPYAQLLGDYYASCMDEAKLEQADAELKAELKKLEAVKDPKSLALAVGRYQAQDLHPLFYFGSKQDAKDATQVIGELDQGGLGLPDRDYYLASEGKMKEVKEAYLAHVTRVFELLGRAPEQAQEAAANVLSLETQLAKASLDKVSRRDPNKVYHRINREGLKKEAPQYPWEVTLKEMGAGGVTAINVTYVPFFQEVARLATEVKPAVWRDYLAFRFVEANSNALPKRFQAERFHFASSAITGAKVDRPRWRKCVTATDDALGEALAQPFVAKTFGPEGKARTLKMVQEIERAFEADVNTLDWMDVETKQRALEKARKIGNKIGYPDKYKTYDGLKIDRRSYLANSMRADAYEVQRDLKKIGKPVDRTEWLMTPPTVNAYYEPPRNEIVFPAGILQPPFFNKEATDAVNFGSMGMVVGHELTHGFDDEGRQYDLNGNLRDWWSEASGKEFVLRVACVEKQFDQYKAIEDVHVNGGLTLGENVADLGGLKLAHSALTDREKQGKVTAEKSRYTPTQQFFLGYAQSWCSKRRPEFARVVAASDPHSPPFLRVNGPLSNLESFRQAFNCQAGQKMVRPAQVRCEVW